MDDYLLAVGSHTRHNKGDRNMDGRRDILHAGLQPGLEPAAGAFDAVDLAVVDWIGRDWVSNGRWFELRLFDRIDSEGVVELGWWRTEILAQLQMRRKHYLLSAEKRQYLGRFVAIADHSFRKWYSDKHSVDYQTCSMRTSHATRTSNHPVEAEFVVEVGSDLVKQKGSCQIVETAEIAGSVDRTARMPSAQALILLVEVLAAHSDCTGIVKFGTASLCHLAKLDSAAVWPMVDLRVAILELV